MQIPAELRRLHTDRSVEAYHLAVEHLVLYYVLHKSSLLLRFPQT